MKQYILKVAQDLEQGTITEDKAKSLLLGLFGVSVSLLDFIEEVKYMMNLYGASNYTRAEQTRDKLAEQLDDIMRLGNER